MFDELALCLLWQWNLWGFRSKLATTGCHFIKTVPLLRRQSGAQSSVQFYMRSWPRFLHTIEPLESYVHTHSAVTHKHTFVSPNCDNYTHIYAYSSYTQLSIMHLLSLPPVWSSFTAFMASRFSLSLCPHPHPPISHQQSQPIVCFGQPAS